MPAKSTTAQVPGETPTAQEVSQSAAAAASRQEAARQEAASAPAVADSAGDAVSSLTAALDANSTDTETIAVPKDQWLAVLQQIGDLTAIVRKSVETGAPPVVVELPTVAEAMAKNPDVPVMTKEGYLVPDSDRWAVSRGNNSQTAK